MINIAREINKLKGPIVIFGVGGFIGVNLMKVIIEIRKDCFGVTHQEIPSWRLAGLSSENIIYADLNIQETILKILEDYRFNTIFNFAAYGGYSKQSDVGLIYRTNLLGTVNLLELVCRQGFDAYVHAGSSSEYGLNSNAPKENAALLPNSHYAVSKVATSYLMSYYGKIKKIPVINLRLYSAYGPFEEPDRLIPTLIKNAIHGKFPPLVDPKISRDFIYVDDVVEAAILAAVYGTKKIPGESVNIATGEKTTMEEIVNLTRELFSIKTNPVWGSMQNRNWDLKDWYGNPTLAKKVLHWESKTSLSDGLIKTYQWMKNMKSGKKPRVIANF